MKRRIQTLICSAILFGTVGLYAQQERFERPERPDNPHGLRIREVVEIRKQMIRIERQAIERDPEMQRVAKEIEAKNGELREKLAVSLANNKDYQGLKERLSKIRSEWMELRGK